jgi:glyoxylase-like metal-dependent hydrolase (beta-lactamase superfamily II)
MKRLASGLLALFFSAIAGLTWSFAPQRLPVTAEALGELPKASPPAGMTLSALPTGSMQSKAGLAFRGGSLFERRDFTMTVALVHHPRGDLLIDSGFGRDLEMHFQRIPALMRAFSAFSRGTPAADQLRAAGYDLGRLTGTVITHAHWDHVSGLSDLAKVPVWMNAEERQFVAEGSHKTELIRSFAALSVHEYPWNGGPHLGFPRSHDVWGDGSVVLVPAPGHTPGSVIVFVALPSGARVAFIGDLVWQREGIDMPAERPWVTSALVDEDPALVRENIARVARVHAQFPQIAILPAHDARSWSGLPTFPLTLD